MIRVFNETRNHRIRGKKVFTTKPFGSETSVSTRSYDTISYKERISLVYPVMFLRQSKKEPNEVVMLRCNARNKRPIFLKNIYYFYFVSIILVQGGF